MQDRPGYPCPGEKREIVSFKSIVFVRVGNLSLKNVGKYEK